jgi:Fe-S cluster assembly ATP-binding protein
MKNQDNLLEIQNLHVSIHGTPIIQGLNLTLREGEVHVIMGTNGSGKSTLANVLARKPDYEITKGSIYFLGKNLLELSPEECAWMGIFLGFQYPVSIPGVSNIQFLKSALNATRKAQGKPLIDAMDFLTLVKGKMAALDMPEALLSRAVNDGFSGGEKKRNEILQMTLLEPKLAILDETDSGLDIDALKTVAQGINNNRAPHRAILLITHYQRILDYIVPDFVHVMGKNGQLVKSGDKSLALELEEKGYDWV